MGDDGILDEWLTLAYIIDPEAEERFNGRALAFLEGTIAAIYIRNRMISELCLDVVFGGITFWDTIPFNNTITRGGEHLERLAGYVGSSDYGHAEHDHVSGARRYIYSI